MAIWNTARKAPDAHHDPVRTNERKWMMREFSATLHYERLRPSLCHWYSSSWCWPLVISLHIHSEVLTFHTKACAELMPPIHRLPPGQ